MTKHFCKPILLRILWTLLFCCVGYGLMQLPGMVMHYKQLNRLAGKKVRPTEKALPVPSVEKPTTNDSLKKESGRQPTPAAEAEQNESIASGPYLEDDEVIKALHTVIDPELGINIVDLGLIRHIEYYGDKELTITMIPTSPLCPYLKHLVAEIKKSVPALTRYEKVRVDVDMQHRWKPEYLSEEGRHGFFGGKL
jgi:metal-sulfur cluster biosynthetic enzyme